MSKRTSAKYKLDRRMGENVFGRPKSPVNRREYGPGQHGQRRKGKLSDFGVQLRAKQKLKGYYGDITEKQFKRTYTEASAMKGDRAAFGAWVTLVDIDNDQEVTYRIVGADEANLDRGTISVTAPMARALINHEAGDEVKVKAPGGVRTYEIVSIRWTP